MRIPTEAGRSCHPLELEVQVVVRYLTWMLRTELWFSGSIRTLNAPRGISPALSLTSFCRDGEMMLPHRFCIFKDN